ncbi:MAG: YadA-like family protein [Negativicoccus succinicivorans]|nr:YadA-like family protein [Negativicoccus succinicivorans]
MNMSKKKKVFAALAAFSVLTGSAYAADTVVDITINQPYERTGLELGTDSYARGEGSIATGKNSVAIGKGATATGSNETAATIQAKLEENRLKLQEIEDKQKSVKQLGDDLNALKIREQKTIEAGIRVEQIRKAKANAKNVWNNAETAWQDKVDGTADAIAEHNRKLVDLNSRLTGVSQLTHSDISTPEGLTAAAEELKGKAEQGTSMNLSVDFYKDYVTSYYKALGDLRLNNKIISEHGHRKILDQIRENPLHRDLDGIVLQYANPYNSSDEKSSSSSYYSPYYSSSSSYSSKSSSSSITAAHYNSLGTYSIDKNGIGAVTAYRDGGKQVYNGEIYQTYWNVKTDIIDQATFDKWNAAKEEWRAQIHDANRRSGDEVFGKFDTLTGGKSTTLFNMVTDMKFELVDLDYQICYYQGQYEATQDKTWLDKKKMALDLREKKLNTNEQTIKDKYQELFGQNLEDTSKLFYTIGQNIKNQWKQENIVAVEEKNKITTDKLTGELERELGINKAAIQQYEKEIQDLRDKADQARRNFEGLNPSEEDLILAREYERVAQELQDKADALKKAADELQDLKDNLKLNDLKDKGADAIAYGTNALVTGNAAIGVGKDVLVTGEDSIALGRQNTVSGTQSAAIGTNNTVTGNQTFVLGSGVTTAAQNAVILGAGSTGEDNTVSVGAAGKERRIINVADPVKDHDAVNLKYLKDATEAIKNSAKSYTGGYGISIDSNNVINDDILNVKYDQSANQITLGKSKETPATQKQKNRVFFRNQDRLVGAFYSDPKDDKLEIQDPLIPRPDRPDYIFVEWNTKPDGAGQSFSPEELKNRVFDEDLTLYAIWKHSRTPVPSDPAKTYIEDYVGKPGTDPNPDGDNPEDYYSSGAATREKLSEPVKITNLAAGEVSKTSLDAINGSQLYELAQNPSTATGINKENWQQFLGDGTNTAGDKGLVTGDTLHKAIESIDVTDQIAGKADVNAGNIDGENKTAWQEKLGDGKVAEGDKGLVTGNTVYDAVKDKADKSDITNAVKDKADTNLNNITVEGKTVIKNIAKDSVKVIDGTNTSVTETTDKAGNKNYAVNVEANGKVEAGNTGIVNGDTVNKAITTVKQDVTTGLEKKADADATNITGTNKTAWQEKLGDGKVAEGDKGLVTGDTVNTAIKGIKDDVNTSLEGKADTNLNNITVEGKTVIKNIAKDSVKVIDGTNTTVTETNDKDGNKNYAVNVAANGKVEAGNTGIVNGDTVNKAINTVKQDVTTGLEKKADADATNITGTNKEAWQGKLGDGKVAEGDKGLVNGNTVYNAVKDKADKSDVTNALKDKADADATNITGANKSSWQEKLGDGKAASGNKGLISGDTLYKAIKDVDVSEAVKNKADTNLNNITVEGKTVIKNIAKDSVKVIDGTNTTVTATTDKDGNKNYAVNVAANGKVEAGNTGIVNGGTVYESVKNKADKKDILNLATVTQQQLVDLDGRMRNGLAAADNKINQTGALAAALAGMKPLDYDGTERTQISAAVGQYHNKHAVALGAYHYFNRDLLLSGGLAWQGSDVMANVGVTLRVGKRDEGAISRNADVKELADEVIELRKQNKDINAQLEDLLEQIKVLKGSQEKAQA